MNQLNHHNFVRILGYGDDGQITDTNTGEIFGCQVFIAMEYIDGNELFEMQKFFQESHGCMGEDIGRFIMA